jgi:hypothetical protein
MGILDNSNNVITVDAVLTDLGRERIARNDGSFEIVRYTFADDEINYKLFNPNTGSLQQDADIVNTPIFEASVNEKIALKYPLITINNPDLKYLPILDATVLALTLGEKTDSQVGKTLEFKQKMQTTGRTVQSEIVDAAFSITLNNDLLFIEKQTPVSISPFGTAQYIIPRAAIGADQGAQVKFNCAVQSLTSDIWSTLGSGAVGSRTITATVKCQGLISGLYEEVTITINEEFSR